MSSVVVTARQGGHIIRVFKTQDSPCRRIVNIIPNFLSTASSAPGQRYIVQLLKAGHEAAWVEAPQASPPVDAAGQMESLPLPAKVGMAGEGGDGYDGYIYIDLW